MNPALLEPLLRSPRLPRLLREAQARLDAERAARTKFLEEIEPHQKGEFIDGQIVMHPPARRRHNEARHRLAALVNEWSIRHHAGLMADEKAMFETERNNYEPDVCYFGPEKAARILPDDVLYPVPDFIAEVLSPFSEKFDRGVKLEDYAAHGVAEYWIIDPVAESVEQYLLPAGAEEFALAVKLREGTLRSEAIPGFTVSARALFDSAAYLAELDRLRR